MRAFPICLVMTMEQVVPLDVQKMEQQENEIEAAKQAALKASMAAYQPPSDLPDYGAET